MTQIEINNSTVESDWTNITVTNTYTQDYAQRSFDSCNRQILAEQEAITRATNRIDKLENDKIKRQQILDTF